MARSPGRITFITVLISLTVWIWCLTAILFLIRWTSIQRQGPPLYEAFPYGEIRIGVDASYPPFAVATADDLFGLDIDLGKAIGNQLGIPVRFINMGYDGLYDSLTADQVDIVISALLVDQARFADVRYTRHYFDAGLMLVTNSDSKINEMNDISGYRLAYEFGSAAHAEAQLWSRRIRPFEALPYETVIYALDAVRLGIGDAALVDATSYHLYKRKHPEWQSASQYVTQALYAVAVRYDHEAAWELVNDALNTLDRSGELEIILRRWL